MAFIDVMMETSDGTKKRVKVPSNMGGTDRRIYVNGNCSGYKLGNNNDIIYSVNGREVSTASIKQFVKQILWLRYWRGFYTSSFFTFKF